MIFAVGLLILLIGLGVWEFRTHQQKVKQIPIRIHVNGTRGKSSVTRLIAGGLRGGGIRTFAKTTGTKARMIHPDGSEIPITRVGKANIIEQLKIVDKALDEKVDALVIECMAVMPPNQMIAEHQMIHATTGVITNVRADHLDEMGPTIKDVAQSLSNTVPNNAVLFTSEKTYLPIFDDVGKKRNSQIRLVQSDKITDEMMRGFSYVEHKDNVALALAVCEHAGVSSTEALKGMHESLPDPGVLRIYKIHYFEKEIKFVNAFAANDPDSYLIIWDLLKSYISEEEKIVVIVNCRKDRIQRTESLAELIAKKLPADHFILVGEFTSALYNKAISLGLPAKSISDFSSNPPEEVFQHVVALTNSATTVLGVGNIVGFGEELLLHFTNKGKELVY
ncbi:MAG: poly-gamma-glutamate synthase PgsB [Ignavibacteriales bacterium]|nr:poly-gamma-glutamate synthase PgsB [Ignavibacteriales bacterium]